MIIDLIGLTTESNHHVYQTLYCEPQSTSTSIPPPWANGWEIRFLLWRGRTWALMTSVDFGPCYTCCQWRSDGESVSSDIQVGGETTPLQYLGRQVQRPGSLPPSQPGGYHHQEPVESLSFQSYPAASQATLTSKKSIRST